MQTLYKIYRALVMVYGIETAEIIMNELLEMVK